MKRSLCQNLFGIVFPFLLGGAIAFVVNVPMRAIERRLLPNSKKIEPFRRVFAYLITIALLVEIIVLSMFVIVPQVSVTVKQIVLLIPSAVDDFRKWLYSITESIPNVQNYISQVDIDWTKLSSQAVVFIKTAGGNFFTSGVSMISNIIGGIATVLIAFIFSIYVLFQKETLSKQIKKVIYAFLSEKKADKIVEVGKLTDRVFSSFLSGQCIEAVILGLMFFVTMTVFRLPYALLIGVVIALSALIPIFGAFIGLGIGTLLIVMVVPMKAVWFIIIFFVLQQIEGNLIYPKVVGGSIGLPSIWVLVTVSIGGSLMGISGILIFIPLCSVCYSLFKEYVNKKLEEKQVPSQKWKNGENESNNSQEDEEVNGEADKAHE